MPLQILFDFAMESNPYYNIRNKKGETAVRRRIIMIEMMVIEVVVHQVVEGLLGVEE